jgi:diguanylate cyclase (GGDEF)-like protein
MIAIFILLAWIISLIISHNTVPTYRASATFLVFPNANLTSSRDVVTSLDTLDRKTVSATYAEIMNSARVYGDAIQKLKRSPKTLSDYNHNVLVQENSNVLVLDVEGPDPQTTAALANSTGQTGINYIKGIYQVFDISFLDQAALPAEPISPQPLRDGAIAAGIGLLVGLLVTLVKEQLRLPIEALRQRSIRDRISGAYSQRHFEHLLEHNRSHPSSAPFSTAVIELDGLQDLVEVLPEGVMTVLMHQVAAILDEQLRGNDVVGRWGKTGFGLILPATPEGPAGRTVERICKALAVPLEVEGLDEAVNLAPYVGLSSWKQDETLTELLARVEKALEQDRSTENPEDETNHPDNGDQA